MLSFFQTEELYQEGWVLHIKKYMLLYVGKVVHVLCNYEPRVVLNFFFFFPSDHRSSDFLMNVGVIFLTESLGPRSLSNKQLVP